MEPVDVRLAISNNKRWDELPVYSGKQRSWYECNDVQTANSESILEEASETGGVGRWLGNLACRPISCVIGSILVRHSSLLGGRQRPSLKNCYCNNRAEFSVLRNRKARHTTGCWENGVSSPPAVRKATETSERRVRALRGRHRHTPSRDRIRIQSTPWPRCWSPPFPFADPVLQATNRPGNKQEATSRPEQCPHNAQDSSVHSFLKLISVFAELELR